MTNITKADINNYINSKQLAWAPSTLRSESARLHAALDLIQAGAQALLEQGSIRYKPYALKTLFIRAGELVEYVYPNLPNEFKMFLKRNARIFKNAYKPERLGVDYKQASQLVSYITDPTAKKLATIILKTGLRSAEALSYDGSGAVIGKGSKERAVLSEDCLTKEEREQLTYSKFHKALAKVGLKPHTLRKLVASQLANGGAKEADLLAIMGWSNIQTAKFYLQPKETRALKALLERSLGNGN